MWILLDSVHTERQWKANLTLMSDVAFMGGLLVENLAVCNGVFTIAFPEQHLKVHLHRTTVKAKPFFMCLP